MPVAPDYMKKAAEQALKARAEAPKSRKAATNVGLARANQLSNKENLSLNTLVRMRSFLLRHRENYERAVKAKLNNSNSKVIQAVNLWGGMRALTWLNTTINALQK